MNLIVANLFGTSLTERLIEKERQRLLLMQREGPNADYIVKTMIPNACTGTLDWFLDGNEFKKWKTSPFSCSI